MRIARGMIVCTVFGLSAAACSTSREEQRAALMHQQSSDVAAQRGEYGVAGAEQRKAEDSHHKAVQKAIDEGVPVPPQTAPGDQPSPSTP
jgi:hypothetical protein